MMFVRCRLEQVTGVILCRYGVGGVDILRRSLAHRWYVTYYIGILHVTKRSEQDEGVKSTCCNEPTDWLMDFDEVDSFSPNPMQMMPNDIIPRGYG